MLMLFSFSLLLAQPVMKLKIDSPSSIQGDYFVQHAAFGYDCNQTISGDIMIIDDGTSDASWGCSSAQNDLTGKIALIDRGGCNFSLKAWNAQEAGAVAVIICNSEPGSFLMTPGLHGDEVTVHTVLMTQEDCNTIKAEIPGASATLHMIDAEEDRTPVVWSEDFNDGMDGWTTTTKTKDDEVFFWSDHGFTTWTGFDVIQGLPNSYCTGAVGFPSGWYQTGKTGVDTLAADGPPYPEYSAELISPMIDLSGEADLLSLKFDQKIRRLNPNSGSNFTFVAYSTDGGENYSDPIPVNTDVEIFDRVNSTVKVNIPEINGHSQVRIKFMYEMDYYYWIIDNVRIVKREDNNLAVTSFYGISPYTNIPISQVDSIYFVGDIVNTGAKTQPNVVFDVSMAKDNNELLYEKKEFDSLEPDSSFENQIFVKSFMPTDKGEYVGNYTVSSDNEDFDNSDNKKTFRFTVTDSIYAKETGRTRRLRPVDEAWSIGNPHSWVIGNVFHIVNNKDSNGEELVCKSIIIGISNPKDLKNQSILALLYKWNDENGDGIGNPGELTEVGVRDYEFTGKEEDQLMIEFELYDSEDEDGNEVVNLEADQDYIAVLQYTDETPKTTKDDLYVEASEDYNYRAQIYLNTPTNIAVETAGAIFNYGFGVGEPRYGTVVGILDDKSALFSDIDYQTNYFRMNITPVIRMKIVPISNILSQKDLVFEHKLNIYPNPASETIRVEFDLKKSLPFLKVNMIDLSGKVLFSNKYNNFSQKNLDFSTSKLPNGIYQMQFISQKGMTTRKFVVLH